MSTKKIPLDSRIQDNIDLITPPAKKELNFIKNNDWAEVSFLEKRKSMYELQSILNNRNITALEKLYSIAQENLGHPEVKKTISTLIQFFYILEERYHKMVEKFDWTSYVDDSEEEGKKAKRAEVKQAEEIEFQSGVLKDYSRYKDKLRSINFGEDVISVNIPIHGDTPVPIIMRSAIEKRYPEIQKFIESKNQQ